MRAILGSCTYTYTYTRTLAEQRKTDGKTGKQLMMCLAELVWVLVSQRQQQQQQHQNKK